MRIDEPEDTLTPAVVEYLRGKIERVKSFEYSLSSFANHVEEVVQNVISRLDDADASQDPELKKEFYILSLFYIEQLDGQIETFRLAERSRKDDRWTVLKYVAFDAANRLNLSSKPVPFFGDSFKCTGSFIYKKYYGLELAPLYQVATNISDPVVFWALIGHEIGHCKLSEKDIPENLKRKLVENNLGDEKYMARLHEILSDILATRIYGLAFFASFVTELRLVSDHFDAEYKVYR